MKFCDNWITILVKLKEIFHALGILSGNSYVEMKNIWTEIALLQHFDRCQQTPQKLMALMQGSDQLAYFGQTR